MTVVRRSDIPLFLRSGSFYANLDQNDDELFEIPDSCFKVDVSVESVLDLEAILQTIQFWGVDEVPIDVLKFVLSVNDFNSIEHILQEFPVYQPYFKRLTDLKEASMEEKIETAIRNEFSVTVVQYLHLSGFMLTSAACECAASMGDLACLTFLHDEGCPWDEKSITSAIVKGKLKCLEYALQSGCPVPSTVMLVAAETGNVPILQYLHDQGIPYPPKILQSATRSKNVDCLKFLHREGCAASPLDCATAAWCGSVECLAFLHEIGAPFTDVGFNAALRGDLACLQYAHTHGEAWTESCCMAAAINGSMECLRYARENGCPWDESVIKNAIVHQSWPMLWYALSNRCPCYDALWTGIELLSCILIAIAAWNRPSDSYWYTFAQVFLPIQRFTQNGRRRLYIVMYGMIWTRIFQVMDFLAWPLSVYFTYANVVLIFNLSSKLID